MSLIINGILEIQGEADIALVQMMDEVVVLGYQSFCDPCQATKPQLEAIASEYDLLLARINCDQHTEWSKAGELVPSVTVFRRGNRVAPPLLGAQSRQNILKYLADTGVIHQ